MIITAKFAGRCSRCGGRYEVGAKIEWSKGGPTSHADCGKATKASASTPPAKAATKKKTRLVAPSTEQSPFVAHQRREASKRANLADRTGEVVLFREHVESRDDAPAKPEHCCYVVVAEEAHFVSADDAEDQGHYDGAYWSVTMYLRAASAEEAAPRLAVAEEMRRKVEAQKARKAAVAELRGICCEGMSASDGDAGCPTEESSATVVLDQREVLLLSADGERVAWWHGGHYDDYRESLRVTGEPRAVELFRVVQAAS